MNRNWTAVLDEYDAGVLVLNRREDNWLIRIFQVHPSWALDFEDDETVLFVRTAPADVLSGRASAPLTSLN